MPPVMLKPAIPGSRVRHFTAEPLQIVALTIRIYHKCEGRIEKSVPRIAVWHHEACRVMTNSDPEEWILLSCPHKNNGFFSCPPLFLYPLYSLDKKGILISYQSQSVVHPSVTFLVNVSPPKPLDVATSNFVAE